MPVAVSDASWQCHVIHTAPLDKSYEDEADPVAGEGACGFDISDEPEGWDSGAFDASEWLQADVYTETQVDPKMGYDEVAWVDGAELVWRRDWHTRRDVEIALFEYINGFHNPRRKHSALRWKSPVAFEQKAA